MFCRHCGEENLDDAVYCKNCGTKLKVDVKKPVIIENENNQQTTTSSSSNSDNSNWIGCCLCLIGIFILFSILGLLGF